MGLQVQITDHWLVTRCSKFFGKADGSKPAPTQQTKLSFATRASDKSKKPTTEDETGVKDEVDEEEKKVKPSSQGSPSSTSAKENAEPVTGMMIMAAHVSFV